MNILIVEDSATLRHAMCQYIKDAGHHPIIAENGEQALQTFDSQDVDMVIMDIEMPGLDGFETTRIMRDWLNQEDIWMPIIFVTGKNEENDLRKGIEVGGDDYLIKPVSETILMAKIRAMERIMAMRNELTRLNQNLVELSERDSLTHLYNRRTFDERAEIIWKQAARSSLPLAVLIMDIDHFKLYNDYYGHIAGDECIQRVAAAIEEGLSRPGDLLARYGGEEFIAMLPNTLEDGAYHVAERLRHNVAALNIRHNDSPTATHITLSVGGAIIAHTSGTELKDQIHAADQALYESKQKGRNRVTVKLFSPRVRILVVDRTGELARKIDSKLTQYVVLLQARSVAECITLAEQNRPDIIVLHENIQQNFPALSASLRNNNSTAVIPQLIVSSLDPAQCREQTEADACFQYHQVETDMVEELNRMLF